MYHKITALFLFLFQFSNLAIADEGFVVRISQSSTSQEVDYGHCSGFLNTKENKIYTAAHCYHFNAFNIRDKNGQMIMDLSEAQYSYVDTDVGILDILVISDLPDYNIKSFDQKLDNIKDFRTNLTTGDIRIFGFPNKFSTLEISSFYCNKISEDEIYFNQKIEISLGSVHIRCPEYSIGSDLFKFDLKYTEVAGLSGGPVFIGNKYIGDAYHFDVSRQFIKIQKLPENYKTLEANIAKSKYQLGTKIFEEVKLPNRVTIRIGSLLMLNYGLNFKKIDSIESYKMVSDEVLEITFTDKETLNVKMDDSTLLKYFKLGSIF